MNTFLWIVLFCFLVALLSVLAAALFLYLPERQRNHLLPHLISFATGTLLGAAFLALLPHALEATPRVDSHVITLTVLLGVLGFFLLEKIMLWHHCHVDECEIHHHVDAHNKTAGPLILIGDAMHNLIHGFLIAAAFLVDIHLGVVTSFAVMAHQVPQELSNFAVLLQSGFPRRQAFISNMMTSLTAVLGGITGYYGLHDVAWLMPYLLAVAVASCIYIAVADLIPGLHQRPQLQATFQQVILIAAGVLIIYSTHTYLHE